MIREYEFSRSIADVIEKRLPHIHQARQFSQRQLGKLRDELKADQLSTDWLIGTYGSYARLEASSQSDLDFFAIASGGADQTTACQKALESVTTAMLKVAGRAPGEDGSFGQTTSLQSILENIGGGKDDNDRITRRILFLLEGEWLFNKKLTATAKSQLIGCYVRNSITSHQMALFLLNDIIRYYRTICVDFEFKTLQAQRPKPWGVRNVKLVFSRKLLYFSGVLAVAETAQCTYERKIAVLNELFVMTPIERVLTICGSAALRALFLYEKFLVQMEKDDVREDLNRVTEANKNDSQVFRDLKDAGHHFSWELINLLRHTYEASHPIHRALIL